jgi:hypothetical protein
VVWSLLATELALSSVPLRALLTATDLEQDWVLLMESPSVLLKVLLMEKRLVPLLNQFHREKL